MLKVIGDGVEGKSKDKARRDISKARIPSFKLTCATSWERVREQEIEDNGWFSPARADLGECRQELMAGLGVGGVILSTQTGSDIKLCRSPH
jgi:hypothetical protein